MKDLLRRLVAAVTRWLPYRPPHHRPSWHTQLHRPEPLTRHNPDTQHSLDEGKTWRDGWPPEWQQEDRRNK